MNRKRIIGFILLSIAIAGHFMIDKSLNLGFWFGAIGGIGGALLLIGKTKKRT